MTAVCHVLVVQHRDGSYQGTCKPCGWEGPLRVFVWEARRDKEGHA